MWDEDRVNRFFAKVKDTGDCWEWTGARNLGGYGVFNGWDRRGRGAHRVAYEIMVGQIPSGLVLDHLCRVRHCVNPAHLEPVTQAVNCARGKGSVTECVHGHSLADAYVYAGRRHCRTCVARRNREWREKQLAPVSYCVS